MNVSLPPWLPELLTQLMQTAERLFGPGKGEDKKAWVKAAVLDAAKKVNLEAIPDWIEDPAKAAIVDIVIDVLWQLDYAPLKREQQRRARRKLAVQQNVRGLVPPDELGAFGEDPDTDEVAWGGPLPHPRGLPPGMFAPQRPL